ncbi:MAG: hypothetical protein KC486_08760 [Myxococcales bacterium]|nr:hypothetical protein [Myxococcales bacterium]
MPVLFACLLLVSTPAAETAATVGAGSPAAEASAGDAGAEASVDAASADVERTGPRSRPQQRRRLGRYLEREVAPSYRYLDHGVLAPELAFGLPHVYRVGLRIGLLDHLTLGATIHWLPGEATPAWSPLVGVAFYRGRVLTVGAHYFRILYPPPVADLDPATISFQQRADHLLGSVSLSQAWFTGGFDIGWVRGLEVDTQPSSADPINQAPIRRDRLAGGIFIRIGNRRWGVSGQVTYPFLSAELAVDLRFGLFERRPKARWMPLGDR